MNSLNAEMSLLGSLLMDSSKIIEIESLVKQESFYELKNGLVFKAIKALLTNGLDVDIITVCNFLEKKKRLKDIGGRAYISELISSVATSTNIKSYAKIIKECYIRRELFKIGQGITGEEIDDVSIYIGDLQERLSVINSNVSNKVEYNINEILNKSYDARCKRTEGEILGYKTGISKLDKNIDGQKLGDFLVVAGYNSHGKSTLLIQLMANALMDGAKCLYLSLESGELQIVNKLLANISNNNIYDFKFPTKNDSVTKAYDKIMNKPLSIIHGVSDIDQIINTVKLYKRKGLVDCFYFDYIQNCTSDNFKNETQKLDYASIQLQLTSHLENIYIATASQTNNQAVENPFNMSSGTRGSGQISASSDTTLVIGREFDKETKQKTNNFGINVKKNRDNETGYIDCIIDEKKGTIKEKTDRTEETIYYN